MTRKNVLNLKSLKDQVYDYLREQMELGEIRPGTVINMEDTSREPVSYTHLTLPTSDLV